MTTGELLTKAHHRAKEIELNNLKFHYNGVKQGKWSLSPKYDNLEELERRIKLCQESL